MKQKIEGFQFNSDFDSANLCSVVLCDAATRPPEPVKDSSKGPSRSTSTTQLAQSAESKKGPFNQTSNASRSVTEFTCLTACDGELEGTPTKNQTWFHFSVEWVDYSSEKPGTLKTVKFT